MRKLTHALMAGLSALTLVLAPAAPALAQRKQLLEYPSIHHPTVGLKGMVVSQNEIASQVGAEILRQGGNAVDAAVAVGFALAVTLPRAGNIGGDGFMLVHMAETKQTVVIDFRGVADLGAGLPGSQGASGASGASGAASNAAGGVPPMQDASGASLTPEQIMAAMATNPMGRVVYWRVE